MPLTWLITYENDGKKGNDFSLIEPRDWLVKYREKLPNLVLLDHIQGQTQEGMVSKYNELISIEKDYPDAFKEPEPEVIKIKENVEKNSEKFVEETIQEMEQNVSRETEDEPINVKIDYEKQKKELKQKRIENARKAREAKKAKKKEKENLQG